MRKSERNVGLDLLRALAIIFVLNCHAASNFRTIRGDSVPGQASPYLPAIQLGGRGVDLFFVLSGWLLGSQLFKELLSTGSIDVRRFWLRRWMRTLPAYYIVLAFTFIQSQMHGRPTSGWPFMIFAQNYLSPLPYFGVSWSLCVEEQFYLVVAPLILGAARYRWMRIVLLPMLLVLPSICRGMGWYHDAIETHVRFDQCAIGVLLAAVSAYSPATWQRLSRFAPVLLAVSIVAAGSNILIRIYSIPYIPHFGELSWAMIFGAWVVVVKSNRFCWKTRFLCTGVQFLASRAYSLYLVHIESFSLLKRIPVSSSNFIFYLLLSWGISLLLAEVLYVTIERPWMELRERLEPSRARIPGIEIGKVAGHPLDFPTTEGRLDKSVSPT